MKFGKILKYFEWSSSLKKKLILIFVILKFWNIGRSTFDHSKFCTPPVFQAYEASLTAWRTIFVVVNYWKTIIKLFFHITHLFSKLI